AELADQDAADEPGAAGDEVAHGKEAAGAASVNAPVLPLPERLEDGEALVAEEAALDLDLAPAEPLHGLVRDRELVEAEGAGVLDGRAEDDAVAAGPVDGREAHRARLRRRVDGAAGEVDGVELAAGHAEGVDLGVRRDVGALPDDVVDARDDLGAAHDARAEGAAALADALHRLADG